jgi:hypothetical protein
MEDDIRSALESAIEEHEETPNDNTVTEGAPATGAELDETAPPAEEGAETVPEVPAEPAPGPAEPVAAATEPVVPEGVPPAPPPTGADKAPGTWTPGAREKWTTLPKEVKEEVWKREKEASRALTMSSEARRFQNEFSQTMQPFLGFIAAENSTPLQAVTNMMQTAALLRVGTPAAKASMVAQVIKDFGIDLSTLDSLLAGEAAPPNPSANMQQLIRQEVAPLMQYVQQNHQREQAQEQALTREVETELNEFSKKEFYWDVKETMEDLMEVSLRRGNAMGLTEAYDRALLLHEPVRRVIEARKARNNAIKTTRTAQAARGNAGSITPSNEAGVVKSSASGSIRDDLMAAIDAQQGR